MTTRHFFKANDIEAAKSMVPQTLVIRGGAIESTGGILVDGVLHDVSIQSMDDSDIYISALAKLTNCTITGKNVLIEGKFDGGVINARGKAEFGSGSVAVGVFNKGDEVYMHPLSDLDDLNIKKIKVVAEPVTTNNFDGGASVSFAGSQFARTGT
jgi:hypothetical protein